MTNPSDRLASMQRQLLEAKEKSSELKGEKNALMKQLQELGIKSVEEAATFIKREQKQITKLTEELDSKIAQLEKDYEWELD